MNMNAVSNVAGGGEPPYDKDMDRRLTVLETRFDAILPTLATKSDLEALRAEVRVGFESLRGEFHIEMEKLRADLFKALNDSMRWMIGVVVSLFIGILAVNVAMFNAVNRKMASKQPSAAAVQAGGNALAERAGGLAILPELPRNRLKQR
jgi:hypothetical protein